MTDDWQQGIQALLHSTHIGFLSSQGESSPETSMCPYAAYRGDIVLHLSGLAKHSKNIEQHPQVGFMVCTPETKADSPLALPRISLTGMIEVVPQTEQQAYQQAYTHHIPDAVPLFSFPDFTLYRIQIDNVQWIGGFGKARKVPLQTWKSLC
jgi:hypothetical protein